MTNKALSAISPIDGRYSKQTESLKQYFSEEALIKYRLLVEIEYFIALCNSSVLQLGHFPADKFSDLRNIYLNFSSKDAQSIKKIESTTNHDVKAVEYFLKARFDDLGLQEFKEFIHFGLTSQDINNTAVPLSVKNAMQENYLPHLYRLIKKLEEKIGKWEEVTMLARTHGQAASPTRLGKEIKVFRERVENQISLLETIPFTAKFGGATGNFNAHNIAFPKIDWASFANEFTHSALGLERQQTTTQIEHYDNLSALMDNLSRINTILIDFSRDIWSYVSMDYFKQKIKKGEVGSSAMPHKVNPIDFENAEGNLAMANAVFSFLSAKLPISRLQRDLSDSTVLRNIGVPFAHTIIAFSALERGLGKLVLNKDIIDADLEKNWAVVAEAIQTILRREGFTNPYETLKDLTRTNSKIDAESIASFIATLDVSEKVKEELLSITPFNYTGI
ncbi:MAG: adenylosuccinate lyase [Bacteroidota bacterium]|nr:adenylosuccinate lyase [Bacteroidota bacterium]